jgi:signal transduction histidine kinase
MTTGDRPAAAPLPPWRRLHVRAAAMVLLVLALLGATTAWISWKQERDGALEATQRLELGLAAAIVAHQPEPLVDASGAVNAAPVRALATHVMMLNPSAEVYLLDADGRVRAHALADTSAAAGTDPEGRLVDLGPVRTLLDAAHDPPMLPVFGTDPRDPARHAIFSAAALPSAATGGSPAPHPPGYLYVVLRSPEAAPFSASRSLQAGAAALALATLAAALVLAGVFRRLTRPLDALTARVQAFRRDDGRASAAAPRDEIALLDDAVDQLQHRVEQQFADLQEADRQRRELVSNISHDLRTPLSAIQGYVETVLLAGDRLAADQREHHLRTALRHADQLGRRVAELFELSTLDAGRVAPVLEVFCLAELLQDVICAYELDARQRGVALSLDGGSHLTTLVRADIALIERVLQNLIDNALRHTRAGGQVRLSLAAAGTQVEVSVADTGSGIAPEHLPHIFERYWHGDSAADTNRAEQAGGLGLAIVKRILELHGSIVHVRSAPEAGSCFRFALPQAA